MTSDGRKVPGGLVTVTTVTQGSSYLSRSAEGAALHGDRCTVGGYAFW
jgi:hypothetical protein